MQKVYVDTNIFLDFWLARESGVKPLGLFAKQFFDDAQACKYSLIVSTFTLKEIELNVKFSDVVKKFFAGFDKLGKVKIVKVTQAVINAAKGMKKVDAIPIHDRIHALIARDEGAILVSRDFHLKQLEKIVRVAPPEEL